MVVDRISDYVDGEVLLVSLIGSRFWEEWKSKRFFNYIKPLGKKYDGIDYDYFVLTGINSVNYSIPCVDGKGKMSLNCVRDSYEVKMGNNEFKVSTLRNTTFQVLKSNINYIYYLTSKWVYVNDEFREFLEGLVKFIPEVVDYNSALKSLYGVSIGSFRSSEGQSNNRKDVSRFINSLRYSIITIYLYHHPDEFEKYIYAYNVKIGFDEIFTEVYNIVKPKFYSDILHYLVDLKSDIFSREEQVSVERVRVMREFIEFAREFQLKVDKL